MAPPLSSRLADIQQLVESLGEPVRTKSRARYEKIRQNAVTATRSTTHSKTNHFAVREQIVGLQEKAEILHRSDLAAELATAVDRANALQSKWMPEHLSLLLQISDRPIDKTNLAHLHALRKGDVEKPLTWDDILRDDPFDDDDVWDDVDFAASSSEDGDDISFIQSEVFSANGTDGEVDPLAALQKSFVKTQSHLLDDVEEWRTRLQEFRESNGDSILHAAETVVLQEVLSMLHGTPTDLFSQASGKWTVKPSLAMDGSSDEVLYSILNQCASLGTQVTKLRDWSDRDTSNAIEQSFFSHLRQALRNFDTRMCGLEQRILDQSCEGPSTLLSFMPEIRNGFRQLMIYAKILRQREIKSMKSVEYLDALYEELERQQSLGNKEEFSIALDVFENALQTFLKPVRNWLYHGQVDDDLEFINQDHGGKTNPANLWSEGFKLSPSTDDTPVVPKFFQPFVHKVVSVGKTAIFLKMLGESVTAPSTHERLPITSHRPMDDLLLTPFSESLSQALQTWISARSQPLGHSLCPILRAKCDLRGLLTALEFLYFGRNDTCFDQVAIRLLERSKNGKEISIDPHVGTAIYQDGFSTSSNVNHRLISIRLNISSKHQASIFDPIAIIEGMSVYYALSWPIANVLKPESLSGYRSIHSLLIKLRIAKLALDHHLWLSRNDEITTPTRQRILFLSLRYRLRWFTNTLSSYLLGTVLPEVHQHLQRIAEFTGEIDDMIELHYDIIKTALKRCMLFWADSPILKALDSMLKLVMKFAFAEVSHSVESPNETGAKGSAVNGENSTHVQQVSTMSTVSELENFIATYSQLHGFIQAGVLERSRSEGDRQLQILAQNMSLETT